LGIFDERAVSEAFKRVTTGKLIIAVGKVAYKVWVA